MLRSCFHVWVIKDRSFSVGTMCYQFINVKLKRFMGFRCYPAAQFAVSQLAFFPAQQAGFQL